MLGKREHAAALLLFALLMTSVPMGLASAQTPGFPQGGPTPPTSSAGGADPAAEMLRRQMELQEKLVLERMRRDAENKKAEPAAEEAKEPEKPAQTAPEEAPKPKEAPPPAPKPEGPTLNETLKWIKSRCRPVDDATEPNWAKPHVTELVEKLSYLKSYTGKSCVVQQDQIGENTVNVYTFEFELPQLDASAVKIAQVDASPDAPWTVAIETRSAEATIKQSARFSFADASEDEQPAATVSMVASVVVAQVQDKDSADRLADAWRHAITLAGGAANRELF